MREVNLFIKRAFDILVSALGCLVLLPFWLIIIALMKLTMPGPVFFKQERVGRSFESFDVLKFRSMKVDREAERSFNIMKDSERITPLGKFLRRSKLDETPQLLNVLKGDMSLVGTRPPTLDEWVKYDLHHRARLAIKPGITGMWQVSGRSEITDFEEVVRLDTDYIQNWDLGLDFKILFKTVANVLTGKGAM